MNAATIDVTGKEVMRPGMRYAGIEVTMWQMDETLQH